MIPKEIGWTYLGHCRHHFLDASTRASTHSQSLANIGIFYHRSFSIQAFEMDTTLDVWKVYKDVLQDHSTFCWVAIAGDHKNYAHPPTTTTKIQYEDFASTITCSWSMVQWDVTQCKFQGM